MGIANVVDQGIVDVFDLEKQQQLLDQQRDLKVW
jgi:hypothetical protein